MVVLAIPSNKRIKDDVWIQVFMVFRVGSELAEKDKKFIHYAY